MSAPTWELAAGFRGWAASGFRNAVVREESSADFVVVGDHFFAIGHVVHDAFDFCHDVVCQIPVHAGGSESRRGWMSRR